MTKTTEPKSDQQNFDDYAGGPKTVTITEVKTGSTEQPIELHLLEFPGRPFKPGKSMRRVLVACWGPDGSTYAGRRMTLFGDPTVKFGKDTVGGIRIAAVSDIAEPVTVNLTVTRGKRKPFTVEPLEDHVGEHLAEITAASTLEELQLVWQAIVKAGLSTRLVDAKNARKAELTQPVDPADPDYIDGVTA